MNKLRFFSDGRRTYDPKEERLVEEADRENRGEELGEGVAC